MSLLMDFVFVIYSIYLGEITLPREGLTEIKRVVDIEK